MSRVYIDCASILKECFEKKKGLNSFNFTNTAVYALTCEVLKYRSVLEEIIEKSELLRSKDGKSMDYYLILILCFDLLFSEKIEGGGKVKKFVLNNKARLQSELARLKIRRKVANNEDLLPEVCEIAQYARVNLVMCNDEEELVKEMKEELKVDYGGVIDPGTEWEKLKESEGKFFKDLHVPYLFVFPPRFKLGLCSLVQKGKLVIQQKASCLPAFLALQNQTNVKDCIDACAAPGNKTSHLVSLLSKAKEEEHLVLAFEKDSGRMKNLEKRMRLLGCQQKVQCIKGDFLLTNVNDECYQNVSTFVVDPSCSGSGIVTRIGSFEEEDKDDEDGKGRLHLLAAFQLKAVLKAMTFPAAKRVVYSTCSIHEEENENVVAEVLRNAPQFELLHVLPNWTCRGKGEGMQSCVRVDSELHRTIGFFVAVFERKSVDETKKNKGKKKKKKKNKKKKKSKNKNMGDSLGRNIESLKKQKL